MEKERKLLCKKNFWLVTVNIQAKNVWNMSENPLVSIVVLNYNAGELLLNCIESIKKSSYKNLEIIVVDNISTDKSQEICKEKYPNIKLIQNDENFG